MKYANHYGYSDIEPYEVLMAINEKTIEVRHMSAERITAPTFEVGGFSAHSDNVQSWKIEPNLDGRVFKIRLHKDGNWRSADGQLFRLSDTPRKFYDYNF